MQSKTTLPSPLHSELNTSNGLQLAPAIRDTFWPAQNYFQYYIDINYLQWWCCLWLAAIVIVAIAVFRVLFLPSVCEQALPQTHTHVQIAINFLCHRNLLPANDCTNKRWLLWNQFRQFSQNNVWRMIHTGVLLTLASSYPIQWHESIQRWAAIKTNWHCFLFCFLFGILHALVVLTRTYPSMIYIFWLGNNHQRIVVFANCDWYLMGECTKFYVLRGFGSKAESKMLNIN